MRSAYLIRSVPPGESELCKDENEHSDANRQEGKPQGPTLADQQWQMLQQQKGQQQRSCRVVIYPHA